MTNNNVTVMNFIFYMTTCIAIFASLLRSYLDRISHVTCLFKYCYSKSLQQGTFFTKCGSMQWNSRILCYIYSCDCIIISVFFVSRRDSQQDVWS